MAPIFSWKQSEFQKLISNCPDEPVTPYIFKYFPAGSRLLEAGCGSGRFVYWLSEKGYDITGLEINPETVTTLNHVYPQLKIQQGDVGLLPYENNSFDGILSLGVIEHIWSGMDQPITEMHRVLKAGGVALVIVPSYNLIRRLKFPTGIYHLSAFFEVLKRQSLLRRFLGKPPLPTGLISRQTGRPRFWRWPVFGEFFEYRLTMTQFEAQLLKGGFELLESVPTSLVDGLYHEFGWPLVTFRDLTFTLSPLGARINRFLSRRSFWHNHMHLCVVRKSANG